MRIVFIGGWGLYPPNLSYLYKNLVDKQNTFFFSWEDFFLSKISTPKLNNLFEEECIVVAWSLGAFCLHFYLEQYSKIKNHIKKIILISCAKSFIQNELNPTGTPSKKLIQMENTIGDIFSFDKNKKKVDFSLIDREYYSFRKTMNVFYKNIFFSSSDHSFERISENEDFSEEKSQTISSANQQYWQNYLNNSNIIWIENLIRGLELLREITLEKSLPYPVTIVQGEDDLILNHKGAKAFAEDFRYPYIGLEQTGHFVSSEQILRLIY